MASEAWTELGASVMTKAVLRKVGGWHGIVRQIDPWGSDLNGSFNAGRCGEHVRWRQGEPGLIIPGTIGKSDGRE